MSIPILRLLRFAHIKYVLKSIGVVSSSLSSLVADIFIDGGFHNLVSSPFVGCSIFITSAPKSLKHCVVYGPANILDKSITLIPYNGRSSIGIDESMFEVELEDESDDDDDQLLLLLLLLATVAAVT